ncbi:MAG: class I SAM-dependent methyltransferase [Pseudoxanthomonas sp.]
MPLEFSPLPVTANEPATLANRLAESGRIPDPLLRLSMRRMCAQWLKAERGTDAESVFARQRTWLEGLRNSSRQLDGLAPPQPQRELPASFFKLCLGRQMKYGCCYWEDDTTSLNMAEDRMLRLCAERAGIADGQRILELGSGWGAQALMLAQRHPNARITAAVHSPQQHEYIQARCRERAIFNLDVVLGDTRRLQLPEGAFDRIFAVEMFEHMSDYRALMSRIAGWLTPGGKLFAQLVCHRELLHLFESIDDAAGTPWMGRHFFTGGMMPAADTLEQLQGELKMEQRWLLPGTHYEKTANAWLQNQDDNRDDVLKLLRSLNGPSNVNVGYQRWRMFWMACAELFGYAGGNEWMVAQYRFVR